MTKEEHAKVLAALEAITKHFSISRLHESTLADTTVRGQAHEAIAIMRKEPQGLVSVPLKPTTAMLRPFYECPPDELELAWDAMLAISGVLEKAR